MYFEDYEIGMVFDEEIESVSFTEEEIIENGKRFDPRPIHIDKVAAEESQFGEIIASGTFTIMAFWAQWVKTGIDMDGMIAGAGIDYAKWLRPVFADVVYDIKVEVIDKKVHKEGKDGFVTVLLTAIDPAGKAVLELQGTGLIACRG